MDLLLFSALLLGLSGSLHCVGMCGPIALALPLTAKERVSMWGEVAVYHLGRISTYALLGIIFGTLGQGIVLAGMQKTVSIGIGVLMLFGLFFSWSIEHQIVKIPGVGQLLKKLRQQLGQQLRISTRFAVFRVGMLNGLLPCGLVYVALFGAVSAGHSMLGGLYMLVFGLGTMPLLFGLMVMQQRIPVSWKSKLQKLTPVFLLIVAGLLIYRGIRLEVPADLHFWEATNFQPMCH